MNALVRRTNNLGTFFRDTRDTFFARGVDDILKYDFFNSLEANIYENPNGYRLEIAVPGMTRKDISIQVQGDVMSVSAQKQLRDDSWRTFEFNSTMFQRSFVLPKDADVNAINARCRDGLLTIQIRKIKNNGAHRTIKIQGGGTNKNISAGVSWWHWIKHKIARLPNRENF